MHPTSSSTFTQSQYHLSIMMLPPAYPKAKKRKKERFLLPKTMDHRESQSMREKKKVLTIVYHLSVI